MDNEDGSVLAIIGVILAIIFAGATYLWVTMPISAGTATAITSFWATSGLTPGAHYQAGANAIAALNDSKVQMMIVMIVSGLGMVSVALRGRFNIN